MELPEILSHFKGVKRTGNGSYMAICPTHNDRNPSLSIREKDGRILMNCFAGCNDEDILNKIGLRMSDLFTGQKEKTEHTVVNTTKYPYQTEEGVVLYYKERINYSDRTKRMYFLQPDGSKGKGKCKHVLYNLPGVKKAQQVFFVEGEKCADEVNRQGYVATTLDCGAQSKWDGSYNALLDGKEVIILPDNDEPGMEYAKMIKKHIPHAVIKQLPELPPKGDIYDWLQMGHLMSEINSLSETVIDDFEDTDNARHIPKASIKGRTHGDEKKPYSVILLELFEEKEVLFFRNENNEPYAEYPVNNHWKVSPIEGKEFSLWSEQLFFQEVNRTIKKDLLKQAISVLVAKVRFGKYDRIKMYVRVGKCGGGIYYDLADSSGSVLEINSEGWRIVDDKRRLFSRYNHQLPQVMPKQGGEVEKIFRYFNLKAGKLLFLCWLITCFVPGIAHPMPIIHGEKGAAKSTACSLLKMLIDPSIMETMTFTKDEKALLVSLKQHYFLPFDNVSKISNELSDALCRVITGGAIQFRKLFTDSDDFIFTFQRCLAINGISNVANRSDLLDRSILFELERIRENERKELREIMEAFNTDKAEIMGTIFETLSKAMKIYPEVHLDNYPRMADFCRWGYAVAEALGNRGEEFLKQYRENQGIQNKEALEADMVASLVTEYMKNIPEWNGRVSELYGNLIELAPKCGINTKSNAFPTASNALSRRLKAVRSNLEVIGITFEFISTKPDGTHIILRNANIASLPPYRIDPSSILGKSNDKNGDNGDDGDNGDTEDDFSDVEF